MAKGKPKEDAKGVKVDELQKPLTVQEFIKKLNKLKK